MVFPKIVFGTCSLGNLYNDIGYANKLAIVREVVKAFPEGNILIDTAGKYGAGLALEVIGQTLKELGVDKSKLSVSNKLGWKRVPLDPATGVPNFENDVWVNIDHNAVQEISYQGILNCFKQGNELLGFNSDMASVHDPEEYIAGGINDVDKMRRENDILEAYRALFELKAQGVVKSIGVGSKDINVIKFISAHVQLDWVMTACSFTIYEHADSTKAILKDFHDRGIAVINAAVFNGGFLIGGDHFDYQKVDEHTSPEKFRWRNQFMTVCRDYNVSPVIACIQFPLLYCDNYITSIAVGPGSPSHVADYVKAIRMLPVKSTEPDINANSLPPIPAEFWNKLRELKLIHV